MLDASKAFRTAVPDLRCEVRQMIVAGDRVVTHLHFTGHFIGSFLSKRGQGQKIDFIATDIYSVADGRIAEDWDVEDNLTFLQSQGNLCGLIASPGEPARVCGSATVPVRDCAIADGAACCQAPNPI